MGGESELKVEDKLTERGEERAKTREKDPYQQH